MFSGLRDYGSVFSTLGLMHFGFRCIVELLLQSGPVTSLVICKPSPKGCPHKNRADGQSVRDHFFWPTAPLILKPLSIVAEICPLEIHRNCMRKRTGKKLAIAIYDPRRAGHGPWCNASLSFLRLRRANSNLAICFPRRSGDKGRQNQGGNCFLAPWEKAFV